MVRVQHLRDANLCMRGAKMWFDQRGLDFREFLQNGLPIEQIEKIDDALARLVCEAAREDAS